MYNNSPNNFSNSKYPDLSDYRSKYNPNDPSGLKQAMPLKEIYPEVKNQYSEPYSLEKPKNPYPNPGSNQHEGTVASKGVKFMEPYQPNQNQVIGNEDLSKSIFKATQVSTNFRKNQTENYKSLYKNDPAKTKKFARSRFPVENTEIQANNLAKSFYKNPHQPAQPNALAISRINKVKENEKIEGYLLKKNRYFFQKSTRRFCKVKNRKFLYYEVGKTDTALGCIDFDALTIFLNENKDSSGKITSFTLRSKNSYKVFDFSIASCDKNKENIEEWIKVIKFNLKNSQGLVKEIPNRDKAYRYWKLRVIAEENFRKKVDTLDILLFKGFNNMAKVQRFFTRSDYDHVAIFLRSGEDIFFLEATGTDGVGLCNWNTFVENKWNTLYEKLVFRHLKFERSNEVMQKFQDFMLTVLQSEYEISLKKLLKFESRIGKIEDYKGRTFFCSELVASVYKVCGLLNETISAAQYWPGSFSKENKSLPLRKDCKLGDEYLIEFEDSED